MRDPAERLSQCSRHRLSPVPVSTPSAQDLLSDDGVMIIRTTGHSNGLSAPAEMQGFKTVVESIGGLRAKRIETLKGDYPRLEGNDAQLIVVERA